MVIQLDVQKTTPSKEDVMTQPSQPFTTVIAFHGVQLAFPATLPFSHQNGCLVLDFSLGYTGKLVIKPGAI